jgi:hypothetical protein
MELVRAVNESQVRNPTSHIREQIPSPNILPPSIAPVFAAILSGHRFADTLAHVLLTYDFVSYHCGTRIEFINKLRLVARGCG